MLTTKDKFLSKYAEPDVHYNYNDSPELYMIGTKHRTDINPDVLKHYMDQRVYNISQVAHHNSATSDVLKHGLLKYHKLTTTLTVPYEITNSNKLNEDDIRDIYHRTPDMDADLRHSLMRNTKTPSDVLLDYNKQTYKEYRKPRIISHPNFDLDSQLKTVQMVSDEDHDVLESLGMSSKHMPVVNNILDKYERATVKQQDFLHYVSKNQHLDSDTKRRINKLSE